MIYLKVYFLSVLLFFTLFTLVTTSLDPLKGWRVWKTRDLVIGSIFWPIIMIVVLYLTIKNDL